MTLRSMIEVSNSDLGCIHVVLEDDSLDKCSVWLFSHAKRANECVSRPFCKYFNLYFISLQVFNYQVNTIINLPYSKWLLEWHPVPLLLLPQVTYLMSNQTPETNSGNKLIQRNYFKWKQFMSLHKEKEIPYQRQLT